MITTKLEQVAWTMLDGNTMAGSVTGTLLGSLTVRRVDGGMVTIARSKVRAASGDDILTACKFYENLGR